MVKNPPANTGDLGSVSGSESPSGKGNATHSNIPAWGLWRATVHGVTKQSDNNVYLNNKSCVASKQQQQW